MSFAQNRLHVVSNGRVKSPKHVVPTTADNGTHEERSSQLVEILNHFDHSVLESVVQKAETAMVEIHWPARE